MALTAMPERRRLTPLHRCFALRPLRAGTFRGEGADGRYSMFRMREKPVTLKISMIVSFTWIIFILP